MSYAVIPIFTVNQRQQEVDLEYSDLPKKSFFVKYSVCRHIHRNKKVWMGIKMNKADVTGRQML